MDRKIMYALEKDLMCHSLLQLYYIWHAASFTARAFISYQVEIALPTSAEFELSYLYISLSPV